MQLTKFGKEQRKAQNRSSGILLHVSSLPGKFGIGDLGKNAYAWVDFLDQTGTQYWQILPLNPTGYGNSPYQGLSAFAGNPLFIDPLGLVQSGLLPKADLSNTLDFPTHKVDFGRVNKWKQNIFKKAYTTFNNKKPDAFTKKYDAFLKQNSNWLDDFALFMALRENNRSICWSDWPKPYRLRDTQAIQDFAQKNANAIGYHKFLQFIFSQQWTALKAYANNKGIKIIGDIPIFIGFNSADVWSRPELFELNEDREPSAVAGVPPDFFSKTGQLWGNPLYDWQVHKKTNYAWWIDRIKETLKTVDVIRIDHFRGFAGFYRIPAGSKTAENGKWVDGPGAHFFETVRSDIGDLPFIAEDLGVITPDVIALREQFGLPGMRILQFAFSGNADNIYLPHTYPGNCVAYTGTHDSDTAKSWYAHAPKNEKQFCASYLGGHTKNIAREMIRAIWCSNANTAIAPMQDFLQLGSRARMNIPATTERNWEWRMGPDSLTQALASWIKEINITYNRITSDKNWSADEYFQSKTHNT